MSDSPKLALARYQAVAFETELPTATPHRVIQLLLEGALSRLATAQRAMADGQLAEKGECIARVIDIVGELRASLNQDYGSLVEQLDNLYRYVIETLLIAHQSNDPARLSEASEVLREIKLGWDAIADESLPPAAA
ncbi:MAG: flagellar export chaperone FliS [Pseudomonadota bacterium]